MALWHSGLIARVPERRVPNVKNILKSALEKYGTECFGRLIFSTDRKSVGLKRLTGHK